MGIVDRKLREKEERRNLILQATKELVLERGIDALNMQDIADGAELSKAALYLYFSSKEAILTAILEEATHTFTEFVRGRLSEGASGLQSIREIWKGFIDFYGESEDIFILTGIKRHIRPGYLVDLVDDAAEEDFPLAPFVDFVSSLLDKGRTDGTIAASVNPVRTAKIVVMVATSIIDQAARLPRSARDAGDIRKLLHDTLELLLRGLAETKAEASLLSLPLGGEN